MMTEMMFEEIFDDDEYESDLVDLIPDVIPNQKKPLEESSSENDENDLDDYDDDY